MEFWHWLLSYSTAYPKSPQSFTDCFSVYCYPLAAVIRTAGPPELVQLQVKTSQRLAGHSWVLHDHQPSLDTGALFGAAVLHSEFLENQAFLHICQNQVLCFSALAWAYRTFQPQVPVKKSNWIFKWRSEERETCCSI